MPTVKQPPPPEPDESFEKFERLAKQLINVPKKELDAQLAKHEREKGRKKKPPRK